MANGAPRAHHGDTDAHRHPALDHDQALDLAIPKCRARLMAGAAPCLAVARTDGRPSPLFGVTLRPHLPHDPHAVLDPSQRGEYPQALVDDDCMLSLSRGARHGCHLSIPMIIFTCAALIRRRPSSSIRRCLMPPLWRLCSRMASPAWISISTG